MACEGLLTEAEPIVRQVCRQAERRYRGYVQFDDLAQDARMWVFEHADTVQGWLHPEDQAKRTHGAKKLSLSLTRAVERCARKERAAILGYRPEDEWFANKGALAELLPVVIGAAVDGFEVAPRSDTRAPSDPAEGNNRLALLADVTAAWQAHPSVLLARLYGPDAGSETRIQVADSYGVSVQALKRDENRALDMLIRYLGGANPYVEDTRVNH